VLHGSGSCGHEPLVNEVPQCLVLLRACHRVFRPSRCIRLIIYSWLTIGGVIGGDCAHEGRAQLQVVTYVQVNVIRHEPLVGVHIGSRLVRGAHVSRNLSVSF
jgi:hypothetical protein